ncbi:inositol 1,4,5-triphosphate receptor associated 2 [Hemicordylus capensis]|uniref:inositol 1,4,5-triphosphate receptor associated 2 n=1 Tax=Hemicordylus capensis TaxID=884348 RepID=UPI002303380D|nr:inositol 1,4,5-triphosphate receptor associated 2 [Hemicordylus capensis]
MSSQSSSGKRLHNPVDSLYRKIQTINMMDQTSNPTLQIPKFQSKNFDSPQSNVKKNLEEILKKRTVRMGDGNRSSDDAHLQSPCSNNLFPPCSQTATPSHRRISNIRSENVVFSVTRNKERAGKQLFLTSQVGSCLPPRLRSKESASDQQPGLSSMEPKDVPSWGYSYFTSSPNVSVCELKSAEPMFRSPVAKKLSLGHGLSAESKGDESSDISLICEEDLLTTIFSACDVERTGKVAVSKIVDFLRYTTSRSSEDSSLEELCNMLDPDQKDISIDMETYHAIMKEWVEDCKRNWKEAPSEETTTDVEESVSKLQENILAAKRTPVRMNVTSGSLEAFGGDVSRGDLETSDLITCIADLQFNNQKLQEENGQLKLALDAMEEANNRLMEDSEELRSQIKSFQQSVTRVKNLKEELEEAKTSLSASEERRLKMVAQNKQLEKENQSFVLKISCLQEENIQNALDSDGLQKKIVELSRNMAELQMQVHLYENTVVNKDASLHKKDLDIQDLKSTLQEYSSVIETLRVEKNKLVNNIQQLQQELISNGIILPLIYKFNSSIFEGTKSLHCELQLAQEQSEMVALERTALDESLDREVLLLLQGPEQTGERFKAILQKLQEELSQVEELAGLYLLWTADSEINVQETYERKLMDLKQELGTKSSLWLQKLNILGSQKESLDKELIKMAGNLRRMRTEQLHLKKELSSRQHKLELVTQLKDSAIAEGDLLRSALQEVTKQREDASKKVRDVERDLQAACEEARSLQERLEESIAARGCLQAANVNLTHTCQVLELETKEQSTALDSLREKLFERLLCGVLCQKTCCYKGSGATKCLLLGLSCRPTLGCWCSQYTPLLDALTLDSLQLFRRCSLPWAPAATETQSSFEEQHLEDGAILPVMLEGCKCNNHSVDYQADTELAAFSTRMDTDFLKESNAGPLADVLSSSEQIPSQEAASPALDSTKGSHDRDSTLPHTREEKVFEATLEAESAAAAAAEEEVKEEGLNNVAESAGDSSSTEDLSIIALDRNRPKSSVSPSEKEVEAEFLRLSLGFKCDLFTLEKRVRLEERSRDLAEGNLKKEIASALKLLESLASLSEDNQAQEIVKKLQKSLEHLSQYATRVAGKAEMLGAIHQESRVSKAVEVMIQHVENLKRTYTREHAELEELKEVLFQNEKSFSPAGDRDESAIKKLSSSLKQSSLRRVSITALPRITGNAGPALPLAQLNETDGSDWNDKFSRRASWGSKQGEKRPLLQRYISSPSWTESEEEPPETKSSPLEPPAPETRGSKARKSSEKESNLSKWGLHAMCTRVCSWASSLRTSFCGTHKALCVSAITALFFAVLSTLIVGLSFQRPAEAAPVGTGDAWTSIQQLLWPYTGLRHQGPPPV